MNVESTADLVANSTLNINGSGNQERKRTFRQMTFKEKLSYIRQVITVEPLLACYLIPSLICGPALNNLELEKACRVNAAYNDTICDSILAGEHANYTKENDNIQIIVSNLHSWQYPMQNFVPILLILFLGSYSDRHFIRKPFMLLPIFGEFFAVAGCILCVIFMRQLPIEVQGFSQTVIPSFLGGPTMFFMALYAYVSDVSTLEMRTLRIGIIQIVANVCQTLLSAAGGFLFEKIGYIAVLVLGAVIYFIGLCYGYFYIKEKNKRPRYSGAKSFLRDLFNPMHAINTFALVVKRQPGVKLPLLILSLCTFFIAALVIVGEYTIMWLYVQKVFSWTPVNYSYYDTVRSSIALVGNMICLPLFTKVLNIHDAMIIVIAFSDKIVSNFIYTFWDTVAGLYVAPVVGICAGTALTAIRSLATKSVSVQNLAKVLSLISFVETVSSIVTTPVYNTGVYTRTLETFPAAFFFIGIGLFGACILVILPTYCTGLRNMYASVEEPEKQQKNEDNQQTTRI